MNRLKVTARGVLGGEVSAVRSVVYEPPRPGVARSSEQRREEEQLARRVRERRAETEALREARRAQRRQLVMRVVTDQRKALRLEVEEPPRVR